MTRALSQESLEWIVDKIKQNSQEISTLKASVSKTAEPKIYGISRDISSESSAWTRTDDAIGMTATGATYSYSDGCIDGSSDFDAVYPWSDITIEALFPKTTRNKFMTYQQMMVKIPKFWFKRYIENGTEYIKIADSKIDGFSVHPAFLHNNGEQSCIYVGTTKYNDGYSMAGICYEGISGTPRAVSNAALTSGRTTANKSYYNCSGSSITNGWGCLDISTAMAIDMLYLVEFADNNVQSKIGNGIVSYSGSTAITSMTYSSVGNAIKIGCRTGTTGTSVDDSLSHVSYRGLENYWGCYYEWIDGVLIDYSNHKYYVCNIQSSYSDTLNDSYTALSYAPPTITGNIIEEGLDEDNSAYMLPSVTSSTSGSSTTYYADYYLSGSSGISGISKGGCYNVGSRAGIFMIKANSGVTANSLCSYRLIYVPS